MHTYAARGLAHCRQSAWGQVRCISRTAYSLPWHDLGASPAEPRFLEGASTKREKAYVLEEYLSELEAQGWSLAGPVTALWAGERDLERLKGTSEVSLDHPLSSAMQMAKLLKESLARRLSLLAFRNAVNQRQ
jgi:hypothetical protein